MKKQDAKGLGPERDDDFGVYLAQIHGMADKDGKPIKKKKTTNDQMNDIIRGAKKK